MTVECEVTAECNDKRQGEPMARATRERLDQAGIAPPADESGARPPIPAALDTGYFSAEAVSGLERAGFDPHIATERQRPGLEAAFVEVQEVRSGTHRGGAGVSLMRA